MLRLVGKGKKRYGELTDSSNGQMPGKRIPQITPISLIYMKYLYSIRNMRDTSEILDQLRGMRNELRERYHIRSIGIFGSYSRKHQTEQSDLDLVVEFDQPIGMMAFVHLKNMISDRLNIKVDLVTPDGLHPLIRDQIMHEVVYV
jgi:hypothetical protein